MGWRIFLEKFITRPCPWTVNGRWLYGANWIFLVTRRTVLLRCYFLSYGAIFIVTVLISWKNYHFTVLSLKKYHFTVLYGASTVAYGWCTTVSRNVNRFIARIYLGAVEAPKWRILAKFFAKTLVHKGSQIFQGFAAMSLVFFVL